ncbi:hypothetical protein [Streptomyces sp. NPDC056144]|uniref:hypothetical protein n=1 Tax=unclassified Streptomyces TaxID=2593676 RepID=UPI0035DB8BEB
MSILSSIPVLTGNDRTNLTAIDDGLLLRTRHEEITILAKAVARVRAEGSSAVVELRARAGAVPGVFRIDGVDDRRAVAFADGVNSLLLEPEEEVDGLSLVVCDTRKTRWALRHARHVKWLMLGAVVVMVLLAAVGAATEGAYYPPVFVFVTGLAVGFSIAGGQEFVEWLHKRGIRKHGVKEFARPANLPGSFIYPDRTGMMRAIINFGGGPYLEVAYDPEDPADVVALRPALTERLFNAAGMFCGFVALLCVGLMALILADV